MLLRAVVVPAKAIFILLIISTVAAEDRSDEFGPTADCLPKDPLIASWTTLQLSCTLNRTDVSANQVSCEFGAEVLQTTVVDSQTFQVTKENMTRQMSHGHVFCYVNVSGKRLQIAQVVVRVADIPIPPKITGCVVYNWDGMICTWEQPQVTGLQTNYTLYWARGPSVSRNEYSSCVHPNGNTCEWKSTTKGNFMTDMVYHMFMIAENALERKFSEDYSVDISYLVKPDRVTSIHVDSVTNVSAELIWRGPDSIDNVRDLIFNISYHSEWDTEYWEERNFTWKPAQKDGINDPTSRNITLVDLMPYTRYSVSIECRKYEYQMPSGFWSNKTYFNFTTAGSVPRFAPNITSGGYRVRSADSKERTVDVMWQPLHQKFLQGQLKHYWVHYFDANNSRRLNLTKTGPAVTYFHRANLKSDLDIRVTIEAETSEGRNESLKLDSMLIPRAGTEPPKPDIFYAIGHNSEIAVAWSEVSNASGYTVFWCKRELSHECEESLNWESLSPNITNFTVSTGVSHFREFFVALSVEAYNDELQRVISSGFIEADCIHFAGGELLTPENFHLAKDQQAYNMTVEWEKPPCLRTAFIFSYELLYCEKQTCDGKVCCKENQTLIISNSKKKFTVSGLTADVEYEAWIRSRNLTGVSPFSSPVQHLVFRSGLSNGAIAGIVIAAIILIVLMIVGFVTIFKKMKKSCCGQIKIVPPQKVVFNPNSNEQGISSIGYNGHLSIMTDEQNEESLTLLIDNSTFNKNGCLGEKPLKPNGNIGHPSEELIQPLMQGGPPKVQNLYNLEIGPAAGSSISPYTQLAVPGDSATGLLVEPKEINALPPSCDADDDYHTLRDPASEVVLPLAEPKIPEKKPESHTQSYLKAECVPLLGISSSAITPYTTIEQIADPDVIQVMVNPENSSDVDPKAREDTLCQNGATDIANALGVDFCGHIGVVANSQPPCSDHCELADDDVFKDCAADTVVPQPSTIPPLPASYIQLSPTLST